MAVGACPELGGRRDPGTPLGTGIYLGTKVLIGYLRAAATIAVMCLSGPRPAAGCPPGNGR